MKLETSRLIIRNYKDADIKDVSQFLCDKEVMYYIPEEFNTIEDVKRFITENINDYLVVQEKESKEIVGHLYFKAFFENHSYEIGWVFKKKYQGLGYAYESSYALMNYGFKELNIHRIIATAQPENTSSWKLMEKLNMRREGEFKACIPYKDTWWDEYYYAILNREWK